MRSVSWETSVGALATMLRAVTASQLYWVDLYTFTLNNGTVYRYSAGDKAATVNMLTFVKDIIFERGTIANSVGVETDTLDLTLRSNVAAGGSTFGGAPMIPFIAGGGLDGARIELERVFAPSSGSAWVGSVLLFTGLVGQADCTRHYAEMTVNSDLDLLNQMLPRNLYEAACLNTLYDGTCKINKVPLTIAGSVTVGNSRSSFNTTLTKADDWFDLGVITFTSGQNAGQIRTVKKYLNATGVAVTIYPLPFIPQAGDTFAIYPGCDKTLDTCTNKFNNRINFRGFKFIPIAETAQ